jgi:formylglycine-generating enzyme required for sulfatase activity
MPRSLSIFLLAALLPLTLPAADVTSLDLGGGAKLDLAAVPAGTFMMGAPQGSVGAANDEYGRNAKNPEEFQHEVTLTKGFKIGVTEVTQAQYQAVMGNNPSVFKNPKHPVDNVSFEDAVKFCETLSAKLGKTVRLPTEAEWEYAYRAGTTTRYYWGDDLEHADLANHAWFQDNSKQASHPVAQKKPNAWGLYDMGGNVWEWCSDRYKGPYEDKKITDPQGVKTGGERILRGGCWESGPLSARATNRGAVRQARAASQFGFRVVVEE